MGNIKTSFVKTVANEIYEKHEDKLTTDFSKNKEVVKEFADVKSKRLMNMITGYLTKLKKREAI